MGMSNVHARWIVGGKGGLYICPCYPLPDHRQPNEVAWHNLPTAPACHVRPAIPWYHREWRSETVNGHLGMRGRTCQHPITKFLESDCTTRVLVLKVLCPLKKGNVSQSVPRVVHRFWYIRDAGWSRYCGAVTWRSTLASQVGACQL